MQAIDSLLGFYRWFTSDEQASEAQRGALAPIEQGMDAAKLPEKHLA